MNRRTFLQSLIGGVAATAAVRTWPYRIYSFPEEIVIAKSPMLDAIALQLEAIRHKLPKVFENDQIFMQAMKDQERLIAITNRKLYLGNGSSWGVE